MVEEETRQRVQQSLNQASARLGISPPPWGFIDGNTSFWDRVTNRISYSLPAVEFLLRTNDEVDFDGLIGHEARHAWQDFNDFYPDRPNVREIDARIWSGHYVESLYPGRSAEFNFQPIDCSLLSPISRRQRDNQEISERILERSRLLTIREQILFRESAKPRGKPISTAKFIRARLLLTGDAWIWQMWREQREILKKLGFTAQAYHSFQSMIYVLKKMGMIEAIADQSSDFGEKRRVFAIVREFEDVEAWENPFEAYRSG
jgi:hypothetical protein